MSYLPLFNFPIGTVRSSAVSDGGTWLQCNGQVVSQATYPELFKLTGHQPEFSWTLIPPLTSSNPVNQIAFGNSVYVAVGNAGIVYTSPDLSTWTSRTSGVATALNAVCWDADNSLFVAVGASNVILTSPDGVTWTSRTSGVTSTLANVIHANGRTVAVGSAGWISYSTDDVTWTAVQPNATPSMAYVVYANTVWFVAASTQFNSGIFYSTNGTSWNYVTTATAGLSGLSVFAGFDGTNFYLAGQNGTGVDVVFSPTGASWTRRGVLPGVPASSGFTPIIFSGGVIASLLSTFMGYTTDGYATSKRAVAINFPVAISSSNVLANPFGAAQKFVNVAGLYITVDGKNWSIDRTNPWGGSLGNSNSIFKNYYVNSKHFAFNSSGGGGICYAPDPYDPSSQFQIPTKTDPSGTSLFIKAL